MAAESHKDASEITCVIIENMPKQKRAYVKFYDEDDSVEEVAKYKKEEKQEVGSMSMTFPNNQKVLNDPGFWVADTGASVHMTPYKQGVYDIKKSDTKISMGNKHEVSSTEIGKLNGTMCTKNGETIGKLKFENVSLVKSGYNLFSLTLMQLKGWTLHGDKNSIWLQKDGHKLIFDIPIKTPNGVIFATYISRELGNAAIANQKPFAITYEQAHRLFGHIGKPMTKMICKYRGWTLTGNDEAICESCQVSKAKQKSLPKVDKQEVDQNVKRVHLDVSLLKGKKLDDNKFGPRPTKPVWLLIVDSKTQRKVSAFFYKKDEIMEFTYELFSYWKRIGNAVTHLRMDNAGENYLLAQEINKQKWQLDIEVEYTARDTPQQNSLVEVAFNTIACRAKSLMYDANVPDDFRHLLYPKAILEYRWNR